MNRWPTHPPLFWRHMWTFPNKYVCLTEKRYTLSSISLKINDFICVISVKLKNSIWLEDFENDLEYCSLNYGHSSGVGRLQDEPDCKDVSTRHHTTTMHHRHHHTLSTELTNLMGSDGRPVSNHHQGWALRRDGTRGTGQDPVRRFYRDGTGSDTNGTGLDFENVCRDGIGISRNGTGWNFKGRVWMNSFTFWNIIHKVSCPFITCHFSVGTNLLTFFSYLHMFRVAAVMRVLRLILRPVLTASDLRAREVLTESPPLRRLRRAWCLTPPLRRLRCASLRT